MKPILEVQHIGKKFSISHQGKGETTFRESLLGMFRQGKEIQEDFWALKDVKFDIYPGESVGIIGRNGAGKSTLLKILSKITPPTTGKIICRGRIASLLEVGTGFHSELSGRENIYLNGSILGLKRAEISKQFDAIVDFSGVEKFLDTPLKHYSSGMQLRLAFAVAAHLEPEILIIDEVLAVGDAEFQKKCMGKMDEVSKSGRTILFVSHNMGAVQNLCPTSILLHKGKVISFGPTNEIIQQHVEVNSNNDSIAYFKNELTPTTQLRFNWVKLSNTDNVECREFNIGESIVITFSISTFGLKKSAIALTVTTAEDIPLALIINLDSNFEVNYTNSEEEIFSVTIPDIRFYPGKYIIGIGASSIDGHDVYDLKKECISFNIISGGLLTSRNLPKNTGLIFMTPEWERIK
jgi:lipopolysaccharide transport system ATP-binding protein